MTFRSYALPLFAAAMMAPAVASAATTAFVTTDLNIRTGPSASYMRFDTIPGGDRVTVYGCLDSYGWCDIGWAGTRGWVSGNYLAYAGERYHRRPISSVGVTIGVPVIAFQQDSYFDRHYAKRDFYRQIRRDVRQDDRRERRELREERRDVQDAKRDLREERRDLRQTRRAGGDVSEARRDRNEARRDLREEQRDLRRERRD